jgi:hypothetical protein
MLRRGWLVALIVTLVSALYVGRSIDHQWVPHDEGALAQSAERTARGELPHRDFEELYTGGLTEVNALAFRVLGARLAVLRLVLMAAFVLTVPIMYYIASRFVGPVAAALTTVVAVVWSVPNYPAALPSWYNLFLALGALAAVLRFQDTRRRRWLVVCGAAAGLSVCTKIVGIYLVAAIVVTLLWQEQTISEDGAGAGDRGRWFGAAATLVVCVMAALPSTLIRSTVTAATVVHFALPPAAVAAVLARREWRTPHVASRVRLQTAAALLGSFALGCALPLVLFLAPYVGAGAVGDLVRGVFVTPARRLQVAALPLPALASSWPVLVVVAFVGAAGVLSRRAGWAACALLWLILGVVLQRASSDSAAYLGVWAVARVIIPLAVVCRCLLLGRMSERVFATLAVGSFCSLVQFPFSAPIYFCYVAPLGVLATLAALALTPALASPMVPTLGVFFAAFAILFMNDQSLELLGQRAGRREPLVPLGLPRAGLLVPSDDAAEYGELIPLAQRHAGEGGFVYAAPDCPEVPFLAGLRNPTRTLFDIFDDSTGHDARVLATAQARDVHVVVLNTAPEFSPPIDGRLDAALRALYPQVDTVGDFIVRWRP